MGRDNNNAGMHFVRYGTRVSDADAVAFLDRKESELRYQKTREKYEELAQYDNPCILKHCEMKNEDRVHVNFYEESYGGIDDSMYTYVVKNARRKDANNLTLWVGYDIGGKNTDTGEIEPRGYYFYFTNCFSRNVRGRKLLLFEVKKKSNVHLEHAIEMASVFGKCIVNNYFPQSEIDWKHPVYERIGNKGPWMFAGRIRLFRSIKNCELIM